MGVDGVDRGLPPSLSGTGLRGDWGNRVGELGIDEGEAVEVRLVDVGDHQLVGRGQLGLGACEELVKVLSCFATLQERKKYGEIVWMNAMKRETVKQLWNKTTFSTGSGAVLKSLL